MKQIRASGRTNVTLQAAVDKAARAGGGTVEIPAGTYRMDDALHLRTGVHIVGEPGTILRKVPSVSSALVPWVGYGQFEFQVKEPGKFKVGMGVTIGDKNAFGFYETVATIVGREGDTFFIDRPFAHDYSPPAGALVRSTFSLISGHNVTDTSIRQLTLDGNPQEKVGINGCRGGGINLLGAHRVVIEGVEVTNFNGDAISFQRGTDIFVRHCHVHHNKGSGLHPGSGTVRYVMTDNCSEHNSGCGIFYCLRTKYSNCEHNFIAHNGRAGISVGERDTNHMLRHNHITDNGGPGIHLREPFLETGDRLWIEGNELANNGGAAEIVLDRDVHQLCIIGNEIRPRTGKALLVGPGCSEIYFAENTCAVIAGKKRSVRLQKPRKFPAVGPEAAPLDAARHINISKLPRWKNR
ncbi:MAG: hypothetical protein PCFJNLEI_03846 [Verrucomicrobiae bacterium]|nr:hypothetical protein [Verrucomicrobiae bacterium]